MGGAQDRPPVSDTELEVLKVLWDRGRATVRDVADAFKRQRRRLAYNTVLTLMARLRAKGYVTADTREVSHVFEPNVTRDDLLSQALKQLSHRIGDGTASPLVQALIKDQQLTAAEIAHLRKLLDDIEQADTPKPSKKGMRR